MRPFAYSVVVGGLALALAGGLEARQNPPNPPEPPKTPEASPNAAGRPQFVGLWDYNADLSVNAATGRKEQNPRNTTQRGTTRTGGQGPVLPPVGGTGGMGAGYPGTYGRYPGGGYTGGGMTGLAVVFVDPVREAQRDLLEVPETLTIALDEDTVTFTDDLERSRTYPTDSKKHKFQLGAAQYEAKAFWDGSQFKKEIEAAQDFKVFETYFLSEDGNQLFVVLRVGDPTRRPKDAPVNGFNRVYDRVR